METLNPDPILPARLDSRYVPPQLIHLVLDVAEKMMRSKFRHELGDDSSGNLEPEIIRCSVERDVQLVEFRLRSVRADKQL